MEFRRLVSYVRPHRKIFTIAFIMLLIATALDILMTLSISYFIDHYLVPKRWVQQELVSFFVIYFVITVLCSYLHYKQQISFQQMALNIIRHLRHDVFVKVQKLALAYFDRTPTGAMITRITNDTETIKDLYVSVLANLLQSAITIIAVIIGLFILEPLWATASLFLFPAFFILIRLYQKFSRPLFQTARTKLSQLNTRLNETLQGMFIIQAFAQEARLYEKFQEINQEHYDARVKNVRWDALLLRPATDLLWTIVVIVILFVFGWQAIHEQVKMGVLFGFINLIGRVFEPFQQILMQLPRLQESDVSAARIFQLLDEETLAPDQVGDGNPQIAHGEIVFDDVTFAYPNGKVVLKDVSFRVRPGETIGLVGYTGSGKSTIIQLLMRFYEPQKGKITIDGQPLATFREEELRQRIGLVLQDSVVFYGTVMDNIRLQNEDLSDEAVQKAAQLAQADHFIQRYPDKYQHLLAEGGSTLSSGEKQMLSFSRTMVLQPKILLLDEATAHVDSETEEAIQTALESMRKDRTTLIIAHRLSTIQDADHILVMDQGEIVERGTHEELLALQGVYAQMDQLQRGLVKQITN